MIIEEKEIQYNLHSHTFRCGHADGDIEDYVKNAIKKGTKLYGVSDHVFLPGVIQDGIRGNFEILDEYISTFHRVKEKYKVDIKLLLAFECEYSDVFVDYYRSLLKEKKVDYLICGQHVEFDQDKKAHWYFSYKRLDDYEDIERYKDKVLKAIRSGLFLYIAHPDIFCYTVTEITPFIEKVMDEIIDEAIKYDIPLELNQHGFVRTKLNEPYKTFGYPCAFFWKRAKEKGVKIIFGGDYHSPNEMFDDFFVNSSSKMIEENNIHVMNNDEVIELLNDYKKKH